MSNLQDNADRKALDLLVKKLCDQKLLANEVSKSTKKETSSSNMKQMSVARYLSPSKNHDALSTRATSLGTKTKLQSKSPNQMKKKTRSVKKKVHVESPKLTGWLSKGSSKCNKNIVKNCESKENYTSNIKCKKTEAQENFQRYGMKIPTYEDILRFQEKNRIYKEVIENIKPIQLLENKISPVKFLKEESIELVDCKYLTLPEIKEKFYANLTYIKDIFHGLSYNERHKRFICEKKEDNFTDKDLRYSPSLGVFNVGQKVFILSLLHDEFDSEDQVSLNQYHCKVLLPELCLKIFMDEHKMEKKDAVVYLEKVPVEDD